MRKAYIMISCCMIIQIFGAPNSFADMAVNGDLVLSGTGRLVFPDGSLQCTSISSPPQCDALNSVPQIPTGLRGLLLYGGIDEQNRSHSISWQQGNYSFLTSFLESRINNTGSSFDLVFGTASASEFSQSDATEKMRLVGATGSVGIGTAAPSEKLEVNGIVKAAGFKGDGSLLTGITASQAGAEPALGSPLSSGYILSSSLDGSRSWIPVPQGVPGPKGDKGDMGPVGPAGSVGPHLELGDSFNSGSLLLSARNVGKGAAIVAADSFSQDSTPTDNIVAVFGYNQLPFYKLNKAGEPGLSWMIEGNYVTGPGNPKMEGYLQYLSPIDHSYMRPFMTVIDRITQLPVVTTVSGGSALELNLIDGTGNENQRAVGKVALGIYQDMMIAKKPTVFQAGLSSEGIVNVTNVSTGANTKNISINGGIADINHGHAIVWQQGGSGFLTSFLDSRINSTGSSFDLVFGTASAKEFAQSDASEKMRLVGATGNVGIGTAAPAEKLEVNGIIKATGFKGDGSQLAGITASQAGAEPALGNPLSSGYVLSSSLDGSRSWIPVPQGVPGPKGDKGDKGDMGPVGPAGSVGPRLELGSTTSSGRITLSSRRVGRGPAIVDSDSNPNTTSDGNVITMFGYNQLPYYKLSLAGEPGLSWAIEGNKDTGQGNPKMQTYLQYLSPTGNSYTRPFMIVIDRVTQLPVVTTLSGGTGLEFNLIDGTGDENQRVVGNVALGIYSSGIMANKLATFKAGFFSNDTANITKYTTGSNTKSIAIKGGIAGVNHGHAITWQQSRYSYLTSFLDSRINSTGSSFDLVFGTASASEFSQSDATEKMRLVGATGNVGIGTVAPTEKLEVKGIVKADGFNGDGSQISGIVKSIAGRSGSVILSPSDIANPIEYDNGICTTTKTITAVNGPSQKIALGDNCTISWKQPEAGTTKILLKITQSVGSKAVAFNSTKWPSGVVPIMSSDIGAVDIITCYLDGVSVYCQASLDFQ